MTESSPELPGLYELVIVDSTDSAKAHAERLAEKGADEGTIVWAKHQSHAIGRLGKEWISGEDNLHCAIILRLDEPFETCCELSLLASVCVGQAITTVGEPMEELRLGWPDDIYLNRGKVGNVQLSGKLDGNGNVSWMVISVNVNTSEHPSSLGFNASSLKGEGFEVFERTVLMERFTREFLAWINRWAEEGLNPVRKAWSWRGDWKDTEHTVEVDGYTYSGLFHSLEDNGALKLETRRGIISLDLADFHRPEFHVEK